MAKGFFSSTKSYVKNLAYHMGRLVRRQETVSEAFTRIREDSHKLGQSILSSQESSENRQRAIHLVQQGQKRYNRRQYKEAEQLFRDAILEDVKYGFAHLYLGHALYKMGLMKDALAAWKRTEEIDPASEAGLKAVKMIQRVERKRDRVVETLIERTKR